MNHNYPLMTPWSFRELGTGDWAPATVPGTVHTDLMALGRLPNPYEGTNERDVQGVDKKAWEYRTVFDVPTDLQHQNHQGLRFHGLDTYARVYLNGTLLLTADNMFRTWEVETPLRPSGNELRVEFDSPTARGLALRLASGVDLPAGNDMSEIGGLGSMRVSPFVRKAPYHFGWDWGPRLVTSGLWKPVELFGWTGARITDFAIRTVEIDHGANAARLEALIEVEADHVGGVHLDLRWEGTDLTHELALKPGRQTLNWAFDLPSPRLWWCRGQGEPELYKFSLTMRNSTGSLNSRHLTTGIRQVRLVSEPDAQGTTFYVELNGRPVFAKGGNHIPHDLFLPRISEATYRHELESCAAAGFTMVRVWGGGIYESEVFYDLCDRLGLMVWQDFLFACSMYPADEAFLNSVRHEVRDNVKRLRRHPSLVLWCGNNEIDVAWQKHRPEGGWGWKQLFEPAVRDKITADYEAIFLGLLPDEMAQLQPELPYWSSSPMAEQVDSAAAHAFNSSPSGDQHYWGVWHGREPFSNYKTVTGRFMSEFGFQSFPEPKTLLTFASPDQWRLDSDVMKLHQKSAIGNQAIRDYLVRDYHDTDDFGTFAYLSHLLQAEGIRFAMEAHRRNRPHCMGSLYWQINDVWPGPSWAGIDSLGRWKALHYFLKASLADLGLSLNTEGDSLELWVLNDLPSPRTVTLEWATWYLDGSAGPATTREVTVGAATALGAVTLPWKDLVTDPRQQLVRVRLLENGKELDARQAFRLPVKDLALPQPEPTFHKLSTMDGVKVTVVSPVFIKNLRLETDAEGFWEDNYFDVLPGLPRTVLFRSASPGTLVLRWQSVLPAMGNA